MKARARLSVAPRARWAAKLLLAVAALSGCGALRAARSPAPEEVQLSFASLSFMDETRAELDLRVRVQNDEEQPLPISAVRFWLELDGRPFAAGVQALSATVPAKGGAELQVVLPLRFRRRALSTQPRDVVLSVRGRVAVGEGAGALLIPFSGQRLQALARAPVWEAEEE